MKIPVKSVLIAVVVGALAVGAVVVARNGNVGAIEVTTAQVVQGALTPEVFGIGTVEARRAYLIGPTQAARVTRVLVDQGDAVKAGQLLAEFDAVDIDERMQSAGNAQQRARSVVSGAEALVRETASRLALAAGSAKRYRELQQKGFISTDAADARQHEANAAAAAHDAAQAALAAARRDVARLGSDQAGIGRQRAQFRLVSPVDGMVTTREAEPGSTLVAGQAVLRLMDPQSLWVRARIDQGRAAGLAVGQPVKIVLRSQPAALSGRVARIEIGSDSVTEERLVDIALERLPAGLSTGELAEVTIGLPVIGAALSIPSAALHRLDGKAGVWRVVAGRAEFAAVRIGVQTLEGRTQVVEGLALDDEVVEHAARELHRGQRIHAVRSLGAAGS